MADYEKRTVHHQWVEFRLPSPTTAEEFAKAFGAAQHELGEEATIPSDSITVHAEDDHIVLRCEAKHEVNQHSVKVRWADEAVKAALSTFVAWRDGEAQVQPHHQTVAVAIDALRAAVG